MSLILTIDTSSAIASIALAKAGEPVYSAVNHEQTDHAAWIHSAIAAGLTSTREKMHDLKAVGIIAGPGSYTGLRVGMATAKGLCYALGIPLITINTLEAMTHAALAIPADLYCPLIDARRMEVFTALYDEEMRVVMPPAAKILDKDAFNAELTHHRMLFFGSGSAKFQAIISHEHAIFSPVSFEASLISSIINKKYNLNDFADLTYSEPVYVKEVYINAIK